MTKIGLFLAIMLAAGSARAEWTHEVSYRYGGKTSLKVPEPEGFHVTAVVAGEPKEDTIPAIFDLPDEDTYIEVTVVAKDGEKWSKKIEIRSRQQATLTVRYRPKEKEVAKEGNDKPQKRPSFIGSLANSTNRCQAAQRANVRFDLLEDGEKVYEFAVPMGKIRQNIEVRSGRYTVRIFAQTARDATYIFVKSEDMSVGKDGWVLKYGC